MNAVEASHAKEHNHWFIFHEQKILLLRNNETFRLPSFNDISTFKDGFMHSFELGFFNETHCLCAEIKPETITNDLIFIPLKQAFQELDHIWFPLLAKSRQIIDWHKHHKYCGLCGQETTRIHTIFEAHCKSCNKIFYPRISPSIIVLIKKENKILMARGAHFPEGVYGLIAGFVSPGETLEDAVKREVLEEVGISIKNIQYFGSQPWPFPDSLMIAFTADYETGEIIIDNNEIAEAGWYTLDNLPGLPSSSRSIAQALIDGFIDQFKSTH